MENNNYNDPENFEEIMEKIKICRNLKEIYELIIQIYPDWILGFLTKYSEDYPHLQNNWEEAMRQNFSIPTAQIMIVNYFKFDEENHKLLNVFCEIFTKSGFMVRSKYDIFPCKICKAALPTLERFNQMKSSNMNLNVESWDDKCKNCK